MSAKVINGDSETDKEIQAAKIIVDGLLSMYGKLTTEITVVDGDQSCKHGPLFEVTWPGIENGCYYEGRYMSMGEYQSRRRR